VRASTLVALFAAALVTVACGTARAPGIDTDAAATVDGRTIPISQLETFVRAQLIGSGMDVDISPDQHTEIEELQREILAQLIQDDIITAASDDLGITVTEEEVEEQFAMLSEQFGGSQPLQEELDRRGLSEEDLRRQLAAFVRREALNAHFAEAADVDEEELQAAYEERLESRYRVARASHVLVETEEEAEALLAELDEGADFAELAEEHSQDEFSAQRGGDLGENPRGAYVEAFDEALWAAEEGEIVGPVGTEFGYHIIRVEEFRDTPLAEVEDELRQELGGFAAREEYEAWLGEVFAGVDVWVNPRFGEWDPELGAVVPREPLERRPPADTGELPDLDELELDDVEP
jgi:peptidyl-prolyl cis-trans isomerase C